jgi:glutamate dehydrogenase
MEGLHLRGAPVGRGELRWWERPEDFRTGVLGLLKAQLVKNAVIVPAGAKGAFVLREDVRGRDRATVQEKVAAAYSSFVEGLLDVTDDRTRGRRPSPTWPTRSRYGGATGSVTPPSRARPRCSGR